MTKDDPIEALLLSFRRADPFTHAPHPLADDAPGQSPRQADLRRAHRPLARRASSARRIASMASSASLACWRTSAGLCLHYLKPFLEGVRPLHFIVVVGALSMTVLDRRSPLDIGVQRIGLSCAPKLIRTDLSVFGSSLSHRR